MLTTASFKNRYAVTHVRLTGLDSWFCCCRRMALPAARRSSLLKMKSVSPFSGLRDIHEQLELKLESGKEPVNRLVIDQVEKPSDN